MSIFWNSFVFGLTIITNFEVTEEVFVSVGYYPDHQYYDLNLPECGLRYQPRNIHSFQYKKKCFANDYNNQTFYDYSEPHRRQTNVSNRIYLGEPAQLGEAPWAVYLRRSKLFFITTECTGSLITFEWVITTAHCFGDPTNDSARLDTIGSNLNVYGGSIHPYGGLERNVNDGKVYFHPGYIKEPHKYDIALFKLNQPFPRLKDGHNYLINPICIPNRNQKNYNTENATVFGFGRTDDSTEQVYGLVSVNLHKFTIKLRARSRTHEGPNPILEGNTEGNKPTMCGGDSGGSLVQYVDKHNRAVLAAITMGIYPFGAGCTEKVQKNHFVPVSLIVDWILKTIQEN